MANRKPDRSLDELIAELARLAPREQATILDALDPQTRKRIEAMLPKPNDDAATPATPDLSALSGWFVELVESGRTMTPHAHAALGDCARRILSEPATTRVPFSPSLIGRIGARLSGRTPA